MKLLLENWRKLIEGDVLPFPRMPTEEERQAAMNQHSRLIMRENTLISNVTTFYDADNNPMRVPEPVSSALQELIDAMWVAFEEKYPWYEEDEE
tara:strand:+ start:191 stop:472 length:282 start_codon:yes stop_codon:yes gene_type:complete